MPGRFISMRLFQFWLLTSIGLLTANSVAAFEISGIKWPGATTDFYVGLQGSSATAIRWQDAFIAAAEEWNATGDFTFNILEQYQDPCDGNARNGVDFTADVCGNAFGGGVLAVTLYQYRTQVLGPPVLLQTDIAINDRIEFNVFDGNLVQFGINGLDFQRVALHELGHALGLGHEEERPSIMAPNIGNLYRLQADDIDAVHMLYNGLGECAIQTLSPGSRLGVLDSNDCTVAELTVGGTDTSYIDVYQLELTEPGIVDLHMASTALDSVLLLADANLNYLEFDDKSAGQCSSSLRELLMPGTYFVLANTYVDPPRSDCGNVGLYTLQTTLSPAVLPDLGAVQGLTGGSSDAIFRGGVSGDNGISFGGQLRASDSIDIAATITMDPQHVGKPGFIVVAAAVGDTILVQNQNGGFDVVDPAAGDIPHLRNKVLAASESVLVASNLIPAFLDIESADVALVVGYGLDSEPSQIYYHENPLNLRVRP